MFKAAGAAIVFLSCLTIGIGKSIRLKKRCKSLETLILCMEYIASEVAFTKRRIEKILIHCGREYNMEIFISAANKIQSVGIKTAWEQSLCDYAKDLALTPQDITAAQLLAGGISDFTGEEQQKGIRTAIRMLELALEAAREDYAKNAKLYQSGGILCGALAVILLL